MLSSLCLRLLGGCRVFGPAAVAYFMLAAGAWASLVVEIDDLVLERDYILNSSPEVDGIVARLDATFSGVGWQTGLTIAYALERKTAAGGWEPVVLSGGATAMVTSSSILVGATPQTHSWTVEFLPQSTLAMNTKHRLAVEIRQDGDLLAHGHSEERVLFHFTNTVSNDDPYNIRTAVDAVTLVGGRRHALDTADDETLRGFPLRIDWQYRRWDAFSAFLPSSVSRSFTAEVRLRRQSTGETLQTRIFSKSIAAIPSFVTQPEGRRPFAASDVWEVLFLPTGQINPTLGDLFFEVTIRHVDKITTPIEFFTSNPGFNQPGRFNHANGTMFFGETETILTGFASISAGVLIGSNVLLSISGPQGYLAGAPDLTFNAAGVTANAFINSSGTISVAGLTDSVQVHPFTVAAGTAGGLRFVRSGLTLTTAGLRAHVVARLPQGLGYAADEFTNVLANTVVFENVPFNSAQLPTGVHTLNGNWWFVEETKPVRFRVSALQWHAAQGRFDLTSAPVDNVRYVRASEVAALEAIPPGQLVDSTARLKPSNAGFYKAVLDQSSADFHIRTGNRGDARLHAELVIGAVEFTTHFPLRIEISAVGGGLLTVSDDSVTGGGLFGIGESAVDYRADCGNGGACVAPGVFGGFTIAPEAGTLFFTRDGGLTNRVSVGPAAPGFLNLGKIAWGYDCATAQFTNVFSSAKNGVLLISGHFARGGDLSAGVYPESGSMHALHESGLSRLFGPGILSPVRPSQAGFGRATYWAPGLNFAVSEQPSDLVRAIIGCEAVTYSAKPCNLLYVRRSGVTGTLESVPGTFPEVLQIYGYTFDFTFYGQAFRDNSPLPELAYTEGAVRFQEAMPVGALRIELEKITFDCFGNLLGASIPGGSADKQLKYWNADITLHSITFRPGSVPCKRFLVAATSAYSTLIDTALSGDLGIFASGHLINRAGSQTAGIEPVVTSRFHLPGSIELAGSTAENPYTFTPLVHAYFNDFAQAGAQPASGWLNFAGDLGVAFFKAPFVHVHTSARRQFDADSDLVVARSLEPAFPEYDPTNRGFPVDADVSAAAYRGDSGSLPERWRLGVNRRWSNFIDFQYPVSWHRVLRSFRSPEPLGIDVKIFTLTTELTHLDAYSAKMEFATGLDATYLANPFKGLAFLVPDSWLNEAFFNNFGLPASFLNNGHRAIGELLGDRVDPLLTEILDSPGMSAQVASAANLIAVQQWGADTSEDWHGDLRAALATQLKGAESLRGILESLGGPGSTEVPSLVGLTRDRLNALRMAAAVMSEGVFQPHAGGSWTPEKPPGGIFHQVGLLPLDENGEVDFIASRLTGMLHDGLKALSGEAGIDADIAEFFGSLEELNNKLKLMLKVRGPAFKKLTEIFKKLGGDVKKLIEELDSGESALSAEILRIVAESDMNALAEEIADAIAERLRELSGGDALDFADIPPEKLAEVVREGISDGLASAAFMGEFQLVQRQRLYDWNLKLQQASDTVFAESNKITRILVAEILQKATGSLLEQIPYYDTVANFDDIAAARVSGHAHVYGDSMRLLRFDASGKFGFLKPIEFEGFFEVRQLSSKSAGLCTPDPAADEGIGEALQEIIFGATVSSAKGFLTDSKGTLITAGLKLSHDLDATASWIPRAFAGHFSMEGLKITDVMDNVAIEKASAVIGVGRQNSYLGLATAFKYGKWKVAGGVFFGLTCSTEPIKMIDKKVGEILAACRL